MPQRKQDWFPVFEISRMTMRQDAIYRSTYTRQPPDEPAVAGVATELSLPILKKRFPGDHFDRLSGPPGCSYRMAVVSITKRVPGHAKRVMIGRGASGVSSCTPSSSWWWTTDINTRGWNE